ncbi:hypothetical protein A9Q87_02520 [Flavobacteriales bacterium 34_180_T64]|mgnify:CR=1 FL=1|nr:hypothetical protein A9Q87_02520 [Flavobacteriales bacterium 34_180_T64]
MKHLSFLTIVMLFSSCCSAKQAIENTISENTKSELVVKATIVESDLQEDVFSGELINISNEENELILKVVEVELIENQESSSKEAFDHSTWDALLKTYVSEQGNVNYKELKAERSKITNYITELSNNIPKDSWSTNDKMAYWINAYNAMTVDLILRNYPLKSIKDIEKPWEQRLWKLHNKWYNLDEIEHQILRKMNDPRIHFGIVCASVSCPKLQNEAFIASKLDDQLTHATRTFLADTNENSLSENSLKLSKIFKWFAKDFKQNGTLIEFLNTYTDITISEQAKKNYKDYNWNLND